MTIKLIATCAFGLESLLKEEIQKLGYPILSVENGRIVYEGSLEAICRSNIFLRIADRVRILVGEFTARTFDELFEKTKALPWENWVEKKYRFPVEGKSIKSQLFSVPDCQRIVNKAIADRLMKAHNVQVLPESASVCKIEVALLKDRATLSIDTSGSGLHKRGYRKHTGQAPIRETLAAAMVILSQWHGNTPLIDPFCGSGTILIEAGMIARNQAPGMNRGFAAQDWKSIPRNLWLQGLEEAGDLIKSDIEAPIYGYDRNKEILITAKNNISRAGLDSFIDLEEGDVRDMEPDKDLVYLITNPPYGERMDDTEYVERIYFHMGKIFQQGMYKWFTITSFLEFEKFFGFKADKKRKLFNGKLECCFYQYFKKEKSRYIPPKESSGRGNDRNRESRYGETRTIRSDKRS